MTTAERLFDPRLAFDHPVTVGITIAVGAMLVIATIILLILSATGRLSDSTRSELFKRTASWWVLAPLMLGPVLLGAAWVIAFVAILSLLCYREFSRAVGLFRQRRISLVVVLGIVAVTFAVADHWYGLFVALPPLVICIIAAIAITSDQPSGFIQRTGLGFFAFLLFGVCLGHLGYMANDALFRPMLMWLLLCVELNDVFAYLSGKTFGRAKLAPRTSPGKTVGGAIGALILTTALAGGLAHFIFAGTPVDKPIHLFVLGAMISVAGQLSDLMLSSIKRDLGVKDLGVTIPGHGGLLDRFDSLLLVAPVVFHYVGYFRGIGLSQTPRLITGG